ncbi:MAG: SAM-dependent chlorinase/fluorinase, partial [Actinomycetota bacterium]|nr:SAM-dependent chlorinase/fluorinase [Actinomycetota bacterium]
LLLPAAEALGSPTGAVVLDRPALFRHPVSATFHGRDVFAPVAAHLYRGLPLHEVGTRVDPSSLQRLPPAYRRVGDGFLEAEVVSVDRFGNVQLAADADDLAAVGSVGGETIRVTARGEEDAVVADRFDAVPAGALLVHVDSDRRVALAVNRGRADRRLDVGPGDLLQLSVTG